MFEVLCTETYSKWFSSLRGKVQYQVLARINRIAEHGHFGDAKHLTENLSELRWKNGLRVYFVLERNIEGETVILLIGGNKNSQQKDIKEAKRLIKRLQEI